MKKFSKSYRSVRSPLGWLTLAAEKGAITDLSFERRLGNSTEPILLKAAEELERFFTEGPIRFSVKLNPSGTAFQKSVWKALTQIGPCETLSYKDLAHGIGREKAFRAVGNAAGANPIAIMIPCHRLVSSAGLGGYSGGLDKKIWLLEWEAQFAMKNIKSQASSVVVPFRSRASVHAGTGHRL